jgi:hypothetical protein
MNRIISSTLIASLTLLAGCRSQQSATTNAADTTAVTAPLATTAPTAAATTQSQPISPLGDWQNLYLPVKVELLEPAQYSLSGRATMVRDSLLWISLRAFGLVDVGSVYADASKACVVLKKPQKLAMELPLADAMKQYGFTIGNIQDALLGDEEALAMLPSAVKWSVDERTQKKVVVSLSGSQGKVNVSLRLTFDLSSAEVNTDNVRQWTAPGSSYQFITPAQALKALQQM